MTTTDRSREGRALAGRTIVVTRALDQAQRLAALLEAAGGCVVLAPMITIEAPPSWAPLDTALGELDSFSWIVFTSGNAVASVDQRLNARHGAWTLLEKPRIAAVGRATAAALEEHGVRPDIVPDSFHAEALLARIRTAVGSRDRVLIPGAADRSDILGAMLRALGASVTEVAAYVTRRDDHGVRLLRNVLATSTIDALTFTSSSAVRHFAESFSEAERRSWAGRIVIASIGPKTAAAAAAWSLTTDVMPVEATIPSLVEALCGHFTALAKNAASPATAA